MSEDHCRGGSPRGRLLVRPAPCGLKDEEDSTTFSSDCQILPQETSPGGASLQVLAPWQRSQSVFLGLAWFTPSPAYFQVSLLLCPVSIVCLFFLLGFYFPITLLSWAIYLLKFRFILLFCCTLLFYSVSPKLFCLSAFLSCFYGIVGFYWGFTFNGWLLGGC